MNTRVLFYLTQFFIAGVTASLDEYACSFCTNIVDKSVETGEVSFHAACSSLFPEDICMMFRGNEISINLKDIADGKVTSRQTCENHNICSSLEDETWRHQLKTSSSSQLDFRISKAYGSRGYNNIRISVISNRSIESEYFTYSQPFRYRWTQYYLNTGIASIIPGQKTKFTIAGEDFEVLVPEQGEGTRGVIIADPCFTSEFITCVYGKTFSMLEHLSSLLNAINAHDDVSYWNILGDNLYDQQGDNTATWFAALSKESRAKVFGSVPGNHVSA